VLTHIKSTAEKWKTKINANMQKRYIRVMHTQRYRYIYSYSLRYRYNSYKRKVNVDCISVENAGVQAKDNKSKSLLAET